MLTYINNNILYFDIILFTKTVYNQIMYYNVFKLFKLFLFHNTFEQIINNWYVSVNVWTLVRLVFSSWIMELSILEQFSFYAFYLLCSVCFWLIPLTLQEMYEYIKDHSSIDRSYSLYYYSHSSWNLLIIKKNWNTFHVLIIFYRYSLIPIANVSNKWYFIHFFHDFKYLHFLCHYLHRTFFLLPFSLFVVLFEAHYVNFHIP